MRLYWCNYVDIKNQKQNMSVSVYKFLCTWTWPQWWASIKIFVIIENCLFFFFFFFLVKVRQWQNIGTRYSKCNIIGKMRVILWKIIVKPLRKLTESVVTAKKRCVTHWLPRLFPENWPKITIWLFRLIRVLLKTHKDHQNAKMMFLGEKLRLRDNL